MREQMEETRPDDDGGQPEIGDDEHERQSHDLAETFQKHRSQQHKQAAGHDHLALHERWNLCGVVGVADQVRRGVGCREGFRDHEVGGREAHEHEHHDLVPPSVEQPLDHADGADPVGRLPRHVTVDGQRAQQRHEHEDQSRNGSERAGPLEGDRWLIAERAEIVDAAQAHDQPPGIVVVRVLIVVLPRVWLAHSRRAPTRVPTRSPETARSMLPSRR